MTRPVHFFHTIFYPPYPLPYPITMSSHDAFRSKWEDATIQVGAPGDVNITTSDSECPRRIESFTRHFLSVKGDTFETKISTDGLLAGGIVVTPELITCAFSLDPICCCHLLGLKLKNGDVPFQRLLLNRVTSLAVKKLLVNAITLHGICRHKTIPFHGITCHRVCVEEGECSKVLPLHYITQARTLPGMVSWPDTISMMSYIMY